MPKSQKNTKKRSDRNSVVVRQNTRASTGQGGNAFAINASDVGVVRTDVSPKN